MFLYKHWTESPVYITPNLPIYMGIFVFFIETEVSLSFFINIKIYTYYAKKQENIRLVIFIHEPSRRPVDEERAIPHLAALQGNP